MKPIVWIVDDDPLVREILSIALASAFNIQSACSGEEILDRLITDHDDTQPEPGLILLDIEMDVLDGYQTCQRLRQAGLNMPVLFVSAHDTLNERLFAFDAGGNDFISKPFDPDIVLLKAQRAFAQHLESNQIKEAKLLLQETNLRVLHEIGESGVLLAFLRETLRVTDYTMLATSLMHAAADYNITCHVQIRHEGGSCTLTPYGEPSALELSILEHAATLGREFRLGQRLIINNNDVSLLILNMPRDNAKSQNLMSYLNILVESAVALTETIEMRRESAARAEEFMIASFENYSTLHDLHAGYRKQRIDTRMLLQEMIDEFEKSYLYLGLTDNQELTVSTLLQNNADKILHLFDLDIHFDRQFAALMSSIKPKKSRPASDI